MQPPDADRLRDSEKITAGTWIPTADPGVEPVPNVSPIDITLVLRTLDQILGKIAFVIRFMALFTVVTGLLASRGITTHPPLEILRSES